jgi:hypothetical protein
MVKIKDFKQGVIELNALLFSFDEGAITEKKRILSLLSNKTINVKSVIAYHESLLFICAYPEDEEIYRMALDEFHRIAKFIKSLSHTNKQQLNDSGLPYTMMVTRFSCDALTEMIQNYGCKIEIDSFEQEGSSLNSLLNLTLPSVLKLETTAGFDNLELLNHLGIQPKNRLSFLLAEFNKLEATPLVKDHLWESLKIYLNISNASKNFSRSFNSIKVDVYYQNELLKKFDANSLFNKKLPTPLKLNETTKLELAGVIKKSMLLNMRETDTSTFMHVNSLELYHLERGISIALYGLNANRQLPFQSYIGYTAFKNGYPLAYGGSWIFGETAMFGLNILEAFRGGESGYIMCQLLRTYIQRFQLKYVEVENHQFGKDNPDGIKSGAFWFYYRFGFRPIDLGLKKLADKEFEKILKDKAYRTSENTLIQLCESNLALNFGVAIPIKKELILNQIMEMISTEFKGNNIEAIEQSKIELHEKLKLKLDANDMVVFEEMALWVKAFHIVKKSKLRLVNEIISSKAADAYRYNELIKKFVSSLD